MLRSTKLLILFLLGSTAARADHPPEWLRIPAPGDLLPAGVSAWILTQEEKVTQISEETVTYRYRKAIMVFSEAGAKQAVFSIPFTAGSAAVVSSKAWAMSPDGKKCREFGGNEFVIASTSVSSWMWDLSKMVYFDADKYLQPGWIVAYEVVIKSDSTPFDIDWSPRESLPVRFASLQLLPMAGGSVKWKAFSADLPAPVPVGNGGGQSWTASNLAPYDEDIPEGMEHNSMDLRAYLLATPGESKKWADVVRLARAQMDPKEILTPSLDALDKEKIGVGGLWTRIQPICAFVQKEITYLSLTIDSDSMAGYRPHAASDVCDNRYGDCKDKATLLCTLLHGINVEAHVMIVSSGAPRTNTVDWPSAYFNHAIVAILCKEPPPEGATSVRMNGVDYLLFDPTDDQVPFGLLPMDDTGGEGLILAPGVTSTVTIPAFPADVVTISSKVRTVLAADGSGEVDLTEQRFGLIAAEASARDNTQSFAERAGSLEKRIQRRVPLISGLVWKIKDDETAHTWTRTAHFSAQYVGKRMTGGMYVDTDLMSSLPRTSPWEDKSDGWVNITPGTLKREIELDAPVGWEFSELPQDWSLKTASGDGAMRYWIDAGVAKGEIQVKIQGGVLDREAYLGLQRLLNAAFAAERRPVVLKRPKPAVAPVTLAPAH
jgi:hypothetical protein